MSLVLAVYTLSVSPLRLRQYPWPALTSGFFEFSQAYQVSSISHWASL